jgi:holo-ACP synthase/triphosphoribosyl-dephospho-CoA synthase
MLTLARPSQASAGAESAVVVTQRILDARERRRSRQLAMLADGCECVISFTMNIAGPVKVTPLVRRSFNEGLRQLENQLARNGISLARRECTVDQSGCAALIAVQAAPVRTAAVEAATVAAAAVETATVAAAVVETATVAATVVRIKSLMIAIEDGSELGRLFDIDVLAKDGQPVSRQALQLPGRSCLICGSPAHACARGQRHPLSQVTLAGERIMSDHFANARADQIAATACRSMLYEVCATPKPGLVDRANSGAHRDMDIFTFMDSSAVLTLRFRRFYLLGRDLRDTAASRMLDRLRYPGMLAEDCMMSATHGVNTHKGLIFSLGLVCVALGWLDANGRQADSATILATCASIAGPCIEQDLRHLVPGDEATAGERLYLCSGKTGIRGEAAAGFPSVAACGLPTLKRLVSEGYSLNDAAVYTLLSLIAEVTDSSIFARAGLEGQSRAQQAARDLLGRSAWPEFSEVSDLDADFSRQAISPGGCADLLALSFMLYFLEVETADQELAAWPGADVS